MEEFFKLIKDYCNSDRKESEFFKLIQKSKKLNFSLYSLQLIIRSSGIKEQNVNSFEGWIDEQAIKEVKRVAHAKELLELESIKLDKKREKLKRSKLIRIVYLSMFGIVLICLLVFFVIIPFYNSEKEKYYWNEVILENSVNSYDDYLEQFPEGKFHNEALRRKQISELEADELKWREALLINTKKAYKNYLSINKIESKHDDEAKVLLDEIYWREAIEKNTVESFMDYINVVNLYDGKYQEEAYKRIKYLEIKRDISVKELEIEKKLWNKTLASNSIDAYYNYLKQYPRGRYKNQAEMNIKTLE